MDIVILEAHPAIVQPVNVRRWDIHVTAELRHAERGVITAPVVHKVKNYVRRRAARAARAKGQGNKPTEHVEKETPRAAQCYHGGGTKRD